MRESATVRTLLQVIREQQRTITDLNDRLMAVTGHMWTPPPAVVTQQDMPDDQEEVYASFTDSLPPGYYEQEE